MEGHAEEIPLDAATVSLLVCQHSLHECRELSRVFAEIVRVLKPGGPLVIMDCDRKYSKRRFYYGNLLGIRRTGWRRARGARIFYRHAYALEHISGLANVHGLKPICGEKSRPMFCFRSVKGDLTIV